jgi:mannose-6-phosphate isomerase
MRNTVQEYSWGSIKAIPELILERPITGKPQAELWMGAHPKSPSMIEHDGSWISLIDYIDKYPKKI